MPGSDRTPLSVPAGRSAGSPPALETIALSKAFGRLVANDAVSITVPAGTVHAVVGENGAGKTTLMRMVYGLYRPDAGELRLEGEPVTFNSPRDALARGVAMVHQTSLLVGSLTVAENVLLSLGRRDRPSRRAVADRLHRISDENGLGVDPRARVDDLSVGMRQRAEILGALFHEARLVILDEPTTVLTPGEANRLFEVLTDLTARGKTVILVTHKLREVLAITDNVSVLRGGRLVAERPTHELNEQELVRLMVGRDVALTVRDQDPSAPAAAPLSPDLCVRGLTVQDDLGIRRVDDVSFDVRPGEIVALTGVEGNGQREAVAALVGLHKATAGSIELGGVDVTRAGVARRRRLGLGYIPESRATEGVAMDMAVEDNLVLGQHKRSRFARRGIRRMGAVRRFAAEQIDEYAVATAGPAAQVSTLSGGNAQKVVVAREVSKRPRTLLAVQPTQGVDVAAAFAIRSTLRRLRDEGMSILLVTSDLREACDLSDRALVFYNGRIAGELPRERATEETIGALAMGVST